MASLRRVGLFSRQVVETLSPAGLEALLAGASRLSEGQIWDGQYYGSTMVTIDLRQLDGQLVDACDVSTARRLAGYIGDSTEAMERLSELAQVEAQRVTAERLTSLQTEVRVRAEGCWIFIDIDVEGLGVGQGVTAAGPHAAAS